MKVKGIVQGKSITLLEPMAIPDGLEILIDIPDDYFTNKPQWKELEKVIGAWENDEEITQVFAEIDQERHLEHGSDVNFDDGNE